MEFGNGSGLQFSRSLGAAYKETNFQEIVPFRICHNLQMIWIL